MTEVRGFIRVTSRLLLAFLLLSVGVSAVRAQESPLVLVVNAPRYERATQRAVRPRAFSTEGFRCDPADVACARAYVQVHANAQLLFVSVLYERRACVPIVRAGRRVGSRMLQALVVSLSLYDHDGHLVRESRAEMPSGADDREFTTEQVRAFFES